eukprot:2554480-Rhodomonas_salina.1
MRSNACVPSQPKGREGEGTQRSSKECGADRNPKKRDATDHARRVQNGDHFLRHRMKQSTGLQGHG